MNTLLNHSDLNTTAVESSTSLWRASIGLVVVGFVLSGALYSTASVSVAQLIFPEQANGSLIERDGKIIGSSLVGQQIKSAAYFQSRPSASNYSVDGMSGSNLAVSNPQLQKQIRERSIAFAQSNQIGGAQVPDDMITASGSGIDPDISPEAAQLQIKRVAQQRRLSEQEVRQLVMQYTQTPQFGLYGEPRVNVLKLNLALDQRSTQPAR
ncbi:MULTISPECIES: potassium-transporting ATPase subunit KdpC [Acinetobacter]|uniref:Potassium-transporting ATPase KdpC subunit n=1 Tax=Acinetobacter baylyi (strain ATCC 33305 / BD413 / ADP1) TaxID=62977 RepID=Q6F8D0_ACIAD|nr:MULTISPECIES: potassium-transporting ATPase subunit KdpC [Acinetobacter]ENV53232.1 K+-transporting ATPase, C subunit [Acinetobacter baylyi DSM 14961 = CIP 107474]KAF2372130.1 potassium-transporting ATPase subunit C [Acinetobacter baylyi]KAF2372454.1 potassium-transporting ATPase subunit C [Acinetobacter baylyi]KAF2376954.1 potassium-transporting ATPase subunit C [Acinetobacter baylyi]KAF2379745.1 potassium-transporting ATPase subunit C [Acinetobacter baylyi]